MLEMNLFCLLRSNYSCLFVNAWVECKREKMRNLNMVQIKISQIIPKRNGLVVPLRPYSESTKRWTKFWFASGHLCEFPLFSVNEQNKLFVIIWTNTNCPITYNQICIISGFTDESNFFEEWFNILRRENVDELLQNLTLSIRTKGIVSLSNKAD